MNRFKKWLFAFLILCFSEVSARHECELAVCAVFKDEGLYLREWVLFHMAQGVQRFYLYNNQSCDLWYPEIEDLICQGFVIIIPWPYEACDCKEYQEIKCRAYMDCIRRIKHQVRWCAFLDCNDFLFSTSYFGVDLFLNQHRKRCCIAINRHVFGTSNIECAPRGFLIQSLFWKCHPKERCCLVKRYIVQPKYVIGCKCPGEFIFTYGCECYHPNEKHKKKRKYCELDNCHRSKELIRINHYLFRDLFYYNNFYRFNHCCRIFEKEFGSEINFNAIYDDSILNACPNLMY